MSYIDSELIEKFLQKSDKTFDYTKLVRLLNSLNNNYDDREPYACADLIRSIIDYIPPLLGYTLFSEVVANYTWDESERKMIIHLQNFRPDGDSSMHTQISNKKDYFEIEDLPPPRRINTLLEECYKHGEKNDLDKSNELKRERAEKTKQRKGIEIKILNHELSWQNYAVDFYSWHSFMVELEINNYNATKPDYIKVSLEASYGDKQWAANQFFFEMPKQTFKLNQRLKVEAGDIIEAKVYLSDQIPTRGSHDVRFRPDMDTDTYKVVVETQSGYTVKDKVRV